MQKKINFLFLNNQPERIDVFLKKNLNDKSLTRSLITKLIKNNFVYFDDKLIKKQNFLLKKKGTLIIQDYSKILTQEEEIKPWNYNLNIIFENENFLIINKPNNLIVQPTKNNKNKTILNALIFYFKNWKENFIDKKRLGIVHRLDKNTKGLMIIAKNEKYYKFLKKLFLERKIIKKYYAIVFNEFKEKKAIINLPIKKQYLKKKINSNISKFGKTSCSEVTVLKNYKKFALVSVNLKTGRPHQIRVHLKYINHSIVGDEEYYNDINISKKYFSPYKQYLMAYYLSFFCIFEKKTFTFELKKNYQFESFFKK